MLYQTIVQACDEHFSDTNYLREVGLRRAAAEFLLHKVETPKWWETIRSLLVVAADEPGCNLGTYVSHLPFFFSFRVKALGFGRHML